MSSDSNLLKSNAKGEPLKGQEVHAQTSANVHNQTSFEQQHHEQKTIAAAPLQTIHGYDIPATKIVQETVVHPIDFGHGKRDITTDKHGNVTKVFNPANKETWELGKKGWTVSQPGCKTWIGREMKVSFKPDEKNPALTWQVNSQEAPKTLDKVSGFNAHHNDVKKTHHVSDKSHHAHKAAGAGEHSRLAPIVQMSSLTTHDGTQKGNGNSHSDTSEDEARQKFFASGISPNVPFKGVDLGAGVYPDNSAWQQEINNVAQLTAKNVEHKAGPFSQLKNRIASIDEKILDFDKKAWHAVIKGHGDNSDAGQHDGKFHQYYESLAKKWKSYIAWSKSEVQQTLGLFPKNVNDSDRIAVAVVAQGEAPRKRGQTHEDRMGSVNLDPNRKAGFDIWLLQNNVGSEESKKIVKQVHDKDPVAFKETFGKHSNLVLTDLKSALAYPDVRKNMQAIGKSHVDVQLQNGADRFQDTRRSIARAQNAEFGQYADNLQVVTLAFILKNRFSPQSYAERLNTVDLSGAKNTGDALVLLSSAFCHKVDSRTGKTVHDGRLNADKEIALVDAVVPNVNISENPDLISYSHVPSKQHGPGIENEIAFEQ